MPAANIKITALIPTTLFVIISTFMILNKDIEKTSCISCGQQIFGDYCSKCGEKKIIPAKDFSLRKFVEQMIDGFTHLGVKFLKSFFLLLFKPDFFHFSGTIYTLFSSIVK